MLKNRRSLNLRSVQVFEAVARLRSIKNAATELGITPSAVKRATCSTYAPHEVKNGTLDMLLDRTHR
jgi:FixJ family two-component response regulator